MGEELPWARGNPQPRSGKRGTARWHAGQRIAPAPSSIYAVSFVISVEFLKLCAQNTKPITVTRKLADDLSYRGLIPPPPSSFNLYHQFVCFCCDLKLSISL